MGSHSHVLAFLGIFALFACIMFTMESPVASVKEGPQGLAPIPDILDAVRADLVVPENVAAPIDELLEAPPAKKTGLPLNKLKAALHEEKRAEKTQISAEVAEAITATAPVKPVLGSVHSVAGMPTIVVATGDVTEVNQAAAQVQKDQATANSACEKAKKLVIEKAGARSKEVRDAAIAQVEKFCHNAQKIVNDEVVSDVTAIAGKKAGAGALESAHIETTKEQALIKAHLGAAVPITGAPAKKMAKDMATAKALRRMAIKPLKASKVKADLACKKAMASAKKAKDVKAATAKAVAQCKKIQGIMLNMKKQIELSIKRTAEGKDPDGIQVQNDLAKQQESQVIAQVKKQASAACHNAQAQLATMVASPKVSSAKKAIAKKQTALLCAKVKALVAGEIAKIKSQVTAGIANGNTAAAPMPAAGGGSMPAADVAALKTAMKKMKAHEADAKARADKVCALAKAKVKDSTGALLLLQRSKAVDMAIHYCKSALRAVKAEVTDDGKALDKVMRAEAAKYGMKVTKTTAGPAQAALSKPLEVQQMAKAKALVDQQLAKERATVTQACDTAKAQIQKLNGPANAAKRARHLQAAIRFCQKAQDIVAHEQKVDYAALAKAAAVAQSSPAVQAAPAKPLAIQPATATSQQAPAAAAAKGFANAQANAQRVNAVATGIAAKTTQMCQAMQSKVHAAEKQGAFEGHPHAESKLLKSAQSFCTKAKGVVAKELAKNKAALAHGMQVARKLGVRSKSNAAEEAKVLVDERKFAVASEKGFRALQAKERKKEDTAKGKATEAAAYAHEVQAAKELKAEMEANKKKFGFLHEKLTKKKMAIVRKQIATNAQCRSIMKNLKTLGQSMASIDASLQDFMLMEDEATLMTMPGSAN